MKNTWYGFVAALILALTVNQTAFAVDGIAVDGLYGIETQTAVANNPELAAQYGLSGSTPLACSGGGGTTNCGAEDAKIKAFQEAVNGGDSSAQVPGSAGFYQVKLQEPLSGQAATLSASNGVDLINQYISMIYMWAASIIGVVAVLMIVVSGLQIIFGGANTEFVSDAKGRIMQALLSLVLLFGTALLLRTINPNFFGFA